jgi:predicted CxxxxCH...CXXCH cytochrome family protein
LASIHGRGIACAAGLLAVVGVLFFAATSLHAFVVGGPHDFSSATGPYTQSTAIAPSGVCSACHIPHGADGSGPLWSRSLSEYVTALTMNGDTSGKPDYIGTPTLACYDCHDAHTSGNINDIPAKSAFSSNHQPQDIAFGGDGPGGANPGYYEHSPANPSGGSYGVYSYPGQFNPTDNLAKTGGHFFRRDPTGSTSSRPDIGDKLSCRDCHEPHSGLDAFIRTDLPDSGATPGLGSSYSSVTASTKMTNNVGRTRNDAQSRKICVACHGYSDNGTPVKYSQINPAYTNSSDNVPKPPITVSDHDSSAQSACVSCHDHDSVGASCTQCHGYPPGPGTVPNYPAAKTPNAYTAANDSHARHVGRQSDAAPNSSSVYSFQCDACHYNYNHQNDNVDIRFSLPAPMPQPSPNGFVATVPPGGVQQCTNVFCHSNGGSDNTMGGYYRSIAWGTTALGCNGCHGVATSPGNRNYGMPDYANGGQVTATANSHSKHVVDMGYECNVCHAGTVSATRTILGTVPTLHVNGTRNVSFGGIATGVGATPYDNGTKTCSVSCHGNAGSATPPRWGGAPMAGCGVCHLDQGASTTPNSANGSHHAHTTYNKMRVACEACHAVRAGGHSNTVHAGGPDNAAFGKTAEVRYTDNVANQAYDNVAAVYLSKDLWNNPFTGLAATPGYTNATTPDGNDTINSTISWTQGTCGNVWCHSNANPVGGANAYRSPQWTDTCTDCHKPGPTDVDCHQCHSAKGTAAQMGAPDNLSRAHILHAASDRYDFTCDECHAWTVPNDSHGLTGLGIITGTGHDNHVNGIKTVKFSATLRTTTVNQSAGVYDDAARKCANTYCHSSGTSTTSFGSPNDNIAWNSAAGSTCTTCHGGSAVSSAPVATGSHTRHLSAGYGCTICHHATVSDNVTISVYDNHVNGQPDVAFDPAAATGTYTAVGKTCSVSCHGADTQVWGGTLAGSCFGCHGGTETTYKPQNNAGVPNPVDNIEYLYSGHGRSGSNYPGSNNLPAGFSNISTAPVDCYYCHSQVAAHTAKDVNDPFRLGYGADATGQKGTLKGAFADNTDLLCLGCHGTSAQRGSNPNAAQGTTTIDALTHARGITGTKYTWPGPNYPWKCVDCHDPHGDGKSGAERYMMIRSGINAPTGSGDTNAGSDAKSRPKRTDANVLAVAFNSLAGYSTTGGVYSYANQGNTAPWGPCEVCHTQTTAYSRTLDNSGSHATRMNRCTTCHPHKSGFAATACKGCHGPDSVATAQAAPDVGTYWTSSGHGRFTTGSPSRPIECEDCHDTSYLTSSAHKTDGSVTGGPPLNINTLGWPGKSPLNADTNSNANTAHLVAGYIDTAATSREAIARKFDNHCTTACHSPGYHTHQLNNDPPGVMRFGDHNTKANPKSYDWYVWDTSNPSNYPTSFYKSRSSWTDNDIRSVAAMSDPAVNFGLCISCHDPHGSGVTETSFYPFVGTSNHMLRGNWLPPAGPVTFCNNLGCHG